MEEAGAPMNGGMGKFSYAKNSHFQREEHNSAKNLIKDVLTQNLDVRTLMSSTSNKFTIADLGCSVGPNTFLAMEHIIDVVEQKYHTQGDNPTNLEFIVYFNDQVANDFNTLFASLPTGRRYYAAGVPGSFWGRLFPESSICVAHSAASVHWISKIPKELLDKNKGKIHYTGATDEVVGAYAAQFEEDMDVFLNARGKEIVQGGVIVITTPGVADGATNYLGITFTFLESILIDMVGEGLIDQDEVDSFNIPHVYPSVEQMSKIVEKNGCFSILKMELRRIHAGPKSSLEHEAAIMTIRAVFEGTFANHFGNKTVEEIFRRVIRNKSKLFSMEESAKAELGTQLFAVLMRK
ncbi:putative S-adenosylmethionine-dependent methyltransferase [Dorcoceras hygrometricum]|uniref:Putative S-adenosylmethionine-dependent methyltransferase n=1 Tax=Dorcoceras hygrometricum TaxID=472368 RepID=A0A2Z7D595_9LAMI|nr:putative S-adenosylmethionine-dependent methyltransferase [Dorcoceras hygrometricum]